MPLHTDSKYFSYKLGLNPFEMMTKKSPGLCHLFLTLLNSQCYLTLLLALAILKGTLTADRLRTQVSRHPAYCVSQLSVGCRRQVVVY